MPNGMKPGSGEDPFADLDETSTEKDEEQQNETSGGGELQDINTAPDESDQTTPDSGSEASGTADAEAPTTRSDLPFRYARDSAKDGRDMVQFFLQSSTQRLESRAQSDLETMLDEDVLLLDVREAAYQVALEEHLDDVADKLREWGYDLE